MKIRDYAFNEFIKIKSFANQFDGIHHMRRDGIFFHNKVEYTMVLYDDRITIIFIHS